MRRFKVYYDQEFRGEVLSDSFTKSVNDESELEEVARSLYDDPHVFFVRWEEIE